MYFINFKLCANKEFLQKLKYDKEVFVVTAMQQNPHKWYNVININRVNVKLYVKVNRCNIKDKKQAIS